MLKFLKIFYEHFIICLSSPLSLFPHHSSTILFLTLVLLQFVVDIAIISMNYPNYHKKIITTYNKYFHYDFPFRFFFCLSEEKTTLSNSFFQAIHSYRWNCSMKILYQIPIDRRKRSRKTYRYELWKKRFFTWAQ